MLIEKILVMKLKSLVLALGLVLVNTCVYAQPKNILPTLEATLSRKVASTLRTEARIPCSAKITPGSVKNIAPYTAPRQRFTVLGNVSNGTFIMDPLKDTHKVISQRPALRDDLFAWKEKCIGKIPSEFRNSKSILFRGMSINNLADLENLLRNGSQVDKTSCYAIYFSSNPSDAFFYMFNSRYNKDIIQVLVTVKSSYKRDYEPIDDGDNFRPSYFRSFDEDIPAKDQEVFVYLHHNSEDDWYHVSLTEQDKIITKRLTAWVKEQKVAKLDTKNNTGVEMNLSEGTSPNP